MAQQLKQIESIKIKDLLIFQEVAKAKSIRETSRRFGLTSGQISKCIQSLEKRFRQRLFKRSTQGVLLTDMGSEFLKMSEEILLSSQRIENLIEGRKKTDPNKTIAAAGTSFLARNLISGAISSLTSQYPHYTFRFLDFAPDQLAPMGLRGAFEIAVHFEKISWPKTWETKLIGKSSWYLCAHNDHPLPKKSTLTQVTEYPFVVPTYWTSEGLTRGDDHFPLPFSKRKLGFETSTAEASLPILMTTNQLAFLPRMLVVDHIKTGKLRQITGPDIPVIERELYLSVRSDLIPAKLFTSIQTALEKRL